MPRHTCHAVCGMTLEMAQGWIDEYRIGNKASPDPTVAAQKPVCVLDEVDCALGSAELMTELRLQRTVLQLCVLC